MYFLIYASSATQAFSREDLLALLAKSRDNNARLGITGMLLYKDGNFIQALEGEEKAVVALYERIAADPRHTQLLPLLRGRQETRQFPEWSMGFRDLNSPEVRQTPGFSEFLNAPLSVAEFAADPTRCQKLLLTFKANMR